MKKDKTSQRQRLGELLVEYGLINRRQLDEALHRQTQSGGQIGSILTEMGFISLDDLLSFLSKQLGVPSANLFKVDIGEGVLTMLPKHEITALKVLPLTSDERGLTVAMVRPQDMATLRDVEFKLGQKVRPVVVPSYQMDAATGVLPRIKGGLSGKVIEKEAGKARIAGSSPLSGLLRQLVDSKGSDMLLTAGVPPSIKIHNTLNRLPMASLTPEACTRYARELMSEEAWQRFTTAGDLDFAVTDSKMGRFRVNAYRQRDSVSITLRHFAENIPSLQDLNLPSWLKDLALRPQGLILITGPAGHGKTTTLAAMIDIINTHRKCNVVTLEDPIEYLHRHKKSNVNQREVGVDTESFSEGLRHVFRQAPDVIVIGELRDKESFDIALRAADSGHLVLSTVHGESATAILERTISMFPPYQQHLVRMRLADSLLLSMSQRLVPRKGDAGRVAAVESLVNSYRIRNLIREEKTHQIRSQMQAGADDFTSIDASLAGLFNNGLIEFEAGLRFADNEKYYRSLTGKDAS